MVFSDIQAPGSLQTVIYSEIFENVCVVLHWFTILHLAWSFREDFPITVFHKDCSLEWPLNISCSQETLLYMKFCNTVSV